MPARNPTMFSTMARLWCTPSPSSLCLKKSIKRTKYIIKSLQAHCWPKHHNVFHNGQAVVHTVSLLSVYKEKRKKDKLYYRSAWPKFNNVLNNGQAVVHTLSLLSVYKEKRKKDTLYYKKPHGTQLTGTPRCSLQWPGCCAHCLPPLCV